MSCTSTAVFPAHANIEFGGEGECPLLVSLYRLTCQFPPRFASEVRDSAGNDFCETIVVVMMMVMVMRLMAICVLLARVATRVGRPKCVFARCAACAM